MLPPSSQPESPSILAASGCPLVYWRCGASNLSMLPSARHAALRAHPCMDACPCTDGAMNYSVHALMYSYFALTSTTRFRAAVLRVAPVITALQISQFAWGTVINAVAAVSYASPGIGCAIQLPILRIGAALYLVYGALFVRLFAQRYLRLRTAPTRACNGVTHDDTNGLGRPICDGGVKAV